MPQEQQYANKLRQRQNAQASGKNAQIDDGTSSGPEISSVEFSLILTIALLNDSLDYFGIDNWLMKVPDILTTLILGGWCLFRLKKFPSTKFGGTMLIEYIPLLGDIAPGWSIFVANTYFTQKHPALGKLTQSASAK